VDPLSTDLPTGAPLEGEELARFLSVRDGLRARIDSAASPRPRHPDPETLWVAGGDPSEEPGTLREKPQAR
jgi:hypothetical protein